MNLMNLYQDKFQDILDFRDLYMAMQKMCDELGLRFGRCANDSKAVLKEKGNDDPTISQIKKATDKIEEEHHAIMFPYKTDSSLYSKLIKQIKNDMLHCKEPFPKTVADACCLISGWKNVYGNSNSRLTEAADNMAFTTTGTEDNKQGHT